ncbi:probable multidrug resistance transporter, MFS superfamily [Saccharopolyspora erythraea NRRL 2338]|nr:MFS transporter [Saccharopolyspora erythraea D]CAM01972.1 probable multidrug resistance transporter, MFS superfamily [Saccharopolyspora erythraea NRRL 2338]
MLGTHLTMVAVNLQVYQLSGSSLQVGLVGFVFGVSLLAGLLAGGVLADRVDRRKVVLGTRAAVVVVFAGLAVNAAVPHPQLWFVYVAAVFAGAINGLGSPALLAVAPALVGPRHLAAAGALTALATQFGAMAGPALAGVIAAGPGLAVCFAVDAGCFLVSVLLLSFLPALPPVGEAGDRHPLRSIAEGVRFVGSNRIVMGLLLVDAWAMVFAMPYALFPELGATHFGGGPSTVGLLYTAPAVGAFAGALSSGWVGRTPRAGAVLIGAVVLWGAAIACVGLAPSLWLALAALAVAGFADTISEVVRRALLHNYTPDHLQGRVSGLWLAQGTTAPSVGNLTTGLFARLVSAPAAPLVGGLVCVVGVVAIALGMPGLRKADIGVRASVDGEQAGATAGQD